jgi:hypothetical protein
MYSGSKRSRRFALTIYLRSRMALAFLRDLREERKFSEVSRIRKALAVPGKRVTGKVF